MHDVVVLAVSAHLTEHDLVLDAKALLNQAETWVSGPARAGPSK
jgi:hypothetical protein